MDKDRLTEIQLYATVLENQPLCLYTGFKTGGNAELMVFPGDADDMLSVVRILLSLDEKFYILGNGSNVLALDEGYRGVVVVTSKANHIAVDDEVITCEAGALLRDISLLAEDKSLTGMEFACGIPGSIGGAVVMNAGAYDCDISDVIDSVYVLDKNGKSCRYSKEECGFSYRTSRFQSDEYALIFKVKLRLRRGERALIKKTTAEMIRKRNEKQPLDYPSCGSFFKRPKGAFASKLIEDCGMKGFRVGGAMVSEKHAGFFINFENATSDDILSLMGAVQNEVYNKTGVALTPEIHVMK